MTDLTKLFKLFKKKINRSFADYDINLKRFASGSLQK